MDSVGHRVLVIIVTYQAQQWLEVCLAPLVHDHDGIDVMVVDNGSTDGTPEAIEADYPGVLLHRRPSNLGFGRANNIGLEYALIHGYRGVLLLNQDASISIESILRLADRAESMPEIGLLSPVHRMADGLQRERGFAYYAGSDDDFGEGQGRDESPAFIDLPFVNAALWYLPLRTLQVVGGFAPLFFHYGEDVDYYHRVVAAGYRAGYAPDISGRHLRTESSYTWERQCRLEEAYHLTQLVRPAKGWIWRYLHGVLEPVTNGLLHGHLSQRVGIAHRIWHRRLEAELWLHRPPVDTEGLRRVARLPMAPVLLLLYNRPEHTRRVLEGLMAQPEISETPLYILIDGPRATERDRHAVAEVVAIAREVAGWVPMVQMRAREHNVGLARNVTEGVEWVFESHERIIVVEDDLRLSPYLLRWMRDVLECYASVSEVAHVHAGTFYRGRSFAPNHLLRFAGSWGWGTWRDRWQSYWEPDGAKLLRALEALPALRRHFDYGGYQPFTRMLRRQTQGLNDSWAIRWHASLLLHGRLSVNAYPALVSNAGFDGTGTHSSGDGRYSVPVAPYPLYATLPHVLEEDAKAYRGLRHYYRRTNNKVAKGWYKLVELYRKWRRHR